MVVFLSEAELLRSEKIVVVEDDEISLGEKVAALKIAGFQNVVEFVNPEKLFDRINDHMPIDLLITDWQMDPYDGVELIDKIKEKGLDIKTLLVSKVPEAPSGYVGKFLRKAAIPEEYESSLLDAVRELLGK